MNLDGVVVQNCVAQAEFGSDAARGGGIYTTGLLALANCTVRNNQALGTTGVRSGNGSAMPGGSAAGGGVCVYNGSASLANTTIDSNLARGGDGAAGGKFYLFGVPISVAGGPAGGAAGGGIYAAANVQLRATNITRNAATGGTGGAASKGQPKGADGTGQGGGLCINPTALVGLDAFTPANTRNNTASTSDNDIFGAYTIL